MLLTPKQQKELAHYFFIEPKNPQAFSYFIKNLFSNNAQYDFDDVFAIVEKSRLNSEEIKAFIANIFCYLTHNQAALFVSAMISRKLPVEFAKEDGQSALRGDSFTATLLSEQAKILVQSWLSPLLIELISELKSFKINHPEEPNWNDPDFSKKFTPIFLKFAPLIFSALSTSPPVIQNNIRLFFGAYVDKFTVHRQEQAHGFVLGSYLILRVVAPFLIELASRNADIGSYLKIGIAVPLQKIGLFVADPHSDTLKHKKESLYGTALHEFFPRLTQEFILPKLRDILEEVSSSEDTGKTISGKVVASFDPEVVTQTEYEVLTILGKTWQGQLLQIIEENNAEKLTDFFRRWQANPTAIELVANPENQDLIILAPILERLFLGSTNQSQCLMQVDKLLFLLTAAPESMTVGDFFKSSSVTKGGVDDLRKSMQQQLASEQPSSIRVSSAEALLENNSILNRLLEFLLRNLRRITPVDLEPGNLPIVSFRTKSILICLMNLISALSHNDLENQYKSLKESLMADKELMVSWLNFLITQINTDVKFSNMVNELKLFLHDDFCFGIDFSTVDQEKSQTPAHRLLNKLERMEDVILDQTPENVEKQIARINTQLAALKKDSSSVQRDELNESLAFWLSLKNYLSAKKDMQTAEGSAHCKKQKQAVLEKCSELYNQLVSFLIEIFKIPYNLVASHQDSLLVVAGSGFVPAAAAPQLSSAGSAALRREALLPAPANPPAASGQPKGAAAASATMPKVPNVF